MDYKQATVAYFGKEKKCWICGKRFLAGDDWVYKRQDRHGRHAWFCSWKHYRQDELEHERKRGRPQNDKKDEIFALFDRGWKMKSVAHALNVPMSTVEYYRLRWHNHKEDDIDG